MKTISIFTSILITLIINITYSQLWLPLGSGMDGFVYALDSYGTDIYAGGNFNTAGGVTGTRFIAKWNGSSWSTVGPQFLFVGPVYTLVSNTGGVIAAGDFNSPGNGSRIVRWNGSSWSNLGSGTTNGIIWTVYYNVYGNFIYAGGTFTQIAGVAANNIARWDGLTWSPLGSGTNGTVLAISRTKNGFDIIVGGSFTSAGGVSVNNVAKWNGTSWSAMENGLDGVVQTLSDCYGVITAGGGFTNHIKTWNGYSWNNTFGIDTGAVYTITGNSGNIFAGGSFNLPGVIPANIAFNDWWRWQSLGSMNDDVLKIYQEPVSRTVYAAGRFTMAGNTPANRIAKLFSFTPIYSRYNLNKDIGSEIDSGRTRDTIGGWGNDLPMGYVITDVNLSIDTVTHTNDSDLEFILIHNGIRDTVINRVGGSGDNFIGTYLNDSAIIPVENGSAPFTGQFRPSKPLSVFNGTSPAGDWILEIRDRATGNNGVLDAWSLSYRLQEVIGIQPISSNVPSQFNLNQNYPNPFNPNSKIKFQISNSTNAKLIVFDVLGREVQTLVNQLLKPGTYEVEFDGSKLTSGVYFYRLITEDFIETKKMVIIK